MKNRTAFVTGANGFIGSYLTKYLAEQGIETIAYILKGTNCYLLENIYPSLKNVKIVEGNVLDQESLRKHVKGINYVFHLAGVVTGYNQKDFDRINVKGTENVLEACLQVNPNVERIVIVSSSAAAGIGTTENPLTEEKEPQPIPNECYGTSKYRQENLAFSYCDYLPVSIVRPCSVFGPGNHVIVGNYKLVKKGFKFSFTGKPRQISVVDVEDITRGIYLCAIEPKAVGEVFYFSLDETISVNDMQEVANYKLFNRKYGSLLTITIPKFALHFAAVILEWIFKLQKKPAPFLNQSKVLAAFAPGQVVSSKKAQKLLGWKPEYTVVESIIREGKWFIDNGWL